MNKQKTISLCMIVKNEEEFLPRCLNSVKEIIDEIIIADTGSTDNTKAIAKNYNAKIFDYEWNSNFAEARNFSMSKASCDWILLLDADEELNKCDTNKLINFINTTELDGCHFTVHSYIGEKITNDYVTHNALRLIKNNKKYAFSGFIHEQIETVDGSSADGRFSCENIVIYHYGYLNNVVNAKEKRARNIPILLKQLEQNPHSGFSMFNLANEYMAQKKTDEALSLYMQAYEKADKNQSFTPHLYFRIIACLYDLCRFEQAVKIADEGLYIYPKCTDFEFYKGLIYYRKNLHLLAADCFNRCLEMGEPPTELSFINGCGNVRPLLCLGELYYANQCYKKCADYFTKALNADNKNITILYKIADALNKCVDDKRYLFKSISGFFSDITQHPNAVVLADILIQQELYDYALQVIDKLSTDNNYSIDILFIKGRIYLFNLNYKEAFDCFKKIVDCANIRSILPNVKAESIKYIFIISLIINADYKEILYNNIGDNKLTLVFESIEKAVKQAKAINLSDEITTDDLLPISFDLLEKLLKLKENELFEKSLFILNSIDYEHTLLPLAKLYYKYDYKSSALEAIINSIKTYNKIDGESAFMLSKLI